MVFLSLIGSFRGPPPGFVDVFPQFFCSLFHWVLLEFLLTVVFCWVKVSFAGPSPAPLGARLVFVFEFFPVFGSMLVLRCLSPIWDRFCCIPEILNGWLYLRSHWFPWIFLILLWCPGWPFHLLAGWSLTCTCLKSLQTSCGWALVSEHYGLKICRGRSQSFGIDYDLICDPVCGLFWTKFHVQLRRMWIQLHLHVKFCKYLWDPPGPLYPLVLLFLWRCCAWKTCQLQKAPYSSLQVKGYYYLSMS